MKEKSSAAVNFAVLCLLISMGVDVRAARFFAEDSAWTQAIPQNPVIATDSAKYVNGIIHADNGGTMAGLGTGEYSLPVWQADVNTPYTTVIIDAQDYVYLNAVNRTSEAQTTGGTPFALMAKSTDYLYIGDVVNKNAVIFKLAALGAGYTLSVDYSKGTGLWGAVTGLSGNAVGFSSAACTTECRLNFNQPVDWSTAAVNGIGARYWLRIKTSSTPTAIAAAYFMAYGDADGEAALRGWNVVPIPNGAKGAGQDTRACPFYPQTQSFDGQLAVLSADGKWIWEFYQARKCDASTLPDAYKTDPVALAWHANAVRKRARTAAAAAEEPYTGDGSGVGAVVDLGGGNYTQYDGMGSLTLCSASAVAHSIITKEDYDSGAIQHALGFVYSGEGPTVPHYGQAPCLKDYGAGTKSDIDANTKYMSSGHRIQLNPAYDCVANIPEGNPGYVMSRQICEAFKTYGAIFYDIGSPNSKGFEAESIYGKPANIWAGLLPSVMLPANVWSAGNLRIVAPVCSDPRVCPNSPDPGAPPAAPSGLSVR